MKGVAVLEGARYVFNKARIHEPDDGYVRMSDETSPILQPFKFYTYYAALHALMYMISDVALARGWINKATGADWEVWAFAAYVILGAHMVSGMLRFISAQYKVQSGITNAVMGFVPVIGAEIHMIKDHFFTAVVFQQALICLVHIHASRCRDAGRRTDYLKSLNTYVQLRN